MATIVYLARRAVGLRCVRVIDETAKFRATPLDEAGQPAGFPRFASAGFLITKSHYEWKRVRPWWAVWRRG